MINSHLRTELVSNLEGAKGGLVNVGRIAPTPAPTLKPRVPVSRGYVAPPTIIVLEPGKSVVGTGQFGPSGGGGGSEDPTKKQEGAVEVPFYKTKLAFGLGLLALLGIGFYAFKNK